MIDERRVRRYFSLYKKNGKDELLILNYKGHLIKLTKEQEKKLIKHPDENLYSRAIDIKDYIKIKYNIEYTPDGLVIALHRLGFSYKKTRPVPVKADVKKQEEFIKTYKNIRKDLKEDETIMFKDAVHPTHNIIPAKAWIKTGTEKEIKSNSGRKRININGAYNPVDNEIIYRKDETINANSIIELFKSIEEKYKLLTTIFIIADNAKYYKSKIIKEYLKSSKIKIIHLPSYSPNLIIIERLWKFFKKMLLNNKYYENKKTFEKAIDDFFNDGVIKHKEDIKKLLAAKFHLLNVS